MTTTTTGQVAKRFHELCSANKFDEAMQELYADNARHVEPMEMPGSPYKRVHEGKASLLKMSEHWCKTTQVHEFSVSVPQVNEDQFVCEMVMDVTGSEGPMAGQRMKMSETCLYTVRDGKIAEAKFFYGGCGQ